MGATLHCPCIVIERRQADDTARGDKRRRRRKVPVRDMGQQAGKPKLTRSQLRELKRTVSFSDAEIRDWYQEFQRSSNAGRDSVCLTEEEFVKVYNAVFPGKCDDFARHVFRTFDIDGNHQVDFKEFLIGLSLSGSDNPKKQLSWAFRLYDVNGDGYITKWDMTNIIRSVFKMIHPDSSADNDLTPESLTDEIFHELDKDSDHRISRDEFFEGATRNQIVLQLLQCGPPVGDDAASAADGGST